MPFTYTLTIPVLFDPATGAVINNQGSPNDLHGITVWDDLNATGVDLTYVSHTPTGRSSGTPGAAHVHERRRLPHLRQHPDRPGRRAVRHRAHGRARRHAGERAGTQFINTAKWDFGRLIDGVFYEPLPGEWGISPPLTIAAPELVVDEDGPGDDEPGRVGQFAIDVQNTGLTDAWDVTLLDRLPDGPTGGMCDLTPEILSAQVFAADGVTPVGKGPLSRASTTTRARRTPASSR